MPQEQGIVLRTIEDGWAEVVTKRRDACENCGASHCCVASETGGKMITRALNKAKAASGDLVALSLEPGVVLKSAAALYLIPIIGFLLGAIIGGAVHTAIGLSEVGGVIALAFVGLAFGYGITALISKRMSKKGALTPVIHKVLARGTTQSELDSGEDLRNEVKRKEEV